MAALAGSSSANDKIVTLNVGGKFYTTTRSTLTRFPDTMLSGMFSGRMSSLRDNQGNYFIDRNGDMFKYILDFLRNSTLNLPEDFKEFAALSAEADFYQIAELSEYLGSMVSVVSKKSGEEFIEIHYIPHDSYTCAMEYSYTVYSSDNILESLPSIEFWYRRSKTDRTFHLGASWENYGIGYDPQIDGLKCVVKMASTNKAEETPRNNRLQLFQDLSRRGFRLITTAENFKTGEKRWTFSSVKQ